MNHLSISKMQCLLFGPFRTFSLLLFLKYIHVDECFLVNRFHNETAINN